MAEFTMPSLGSDMEAGTLAEWLKKPGDHVKRGDIIAEVETDKGVIEVEVFTSGVVERILVEPGTKVPVGTPLAVIKEDTPEPTPPPVVSVEPKPLPVVKASPAARRRARELGVAIEHVTGTGPEGAVTLDDVERAMQTPAVQSPPSVERAVKTDEQRQRMRQAIAAAMTRSKREIPHYYASNTVSVHPLLQWLEARNAQVPPPERLLPVVAFVKAVAVALRDFPELNGKWESEGLVLNSAVHVGAAIALRGGGLVAPALMDADKAPLPELMQRFRDLVTRARNGSLRSGEFTSATITMTSLGDRGTEAVFGIITPPQVAIVGFGRIVERPWVVDGTVVPHRVVTVTLSADHRASDGHRGALFLEAVENLLQKPESL